MHRGVVTCKHKPCPELCCAADVDATDIRVQDRQIGMVFQGYALFKHMTVAQNISFGPRIQDLDIDEEERCVCVPSLLTP